MSKLLFAVALSLSAVAAWYAIAGLVAIFAASVIPIIVMGSLLESSKLVVASWLYRNWKDIPRLMKSYFVVALVILMMLTSMGIFGFLSKAHLDQAVPSGEVAAKLSLVDEKIKTEKENINANRKELSQLDSQVDTTISRTTDSSGAERAIAIRKGQQKERTRILKEIGDSQTKIAKLNEERAPIASEVRKVEAEVGPIKYIAALIYGDNPDENVLEKAVRIVTMMIVIVFDPLAVLMLVAANWTLRKESEQKVEVVTETKEVVVPPTAPTDWSIFFSNPPADNFPEIKHPDEETPAEQPTEQKPEEELPEFDIEAPTTDWQPEESDKPKKQVGRYLRELNAKPSKTQSFLNRVQEVFSSNTIEQEVEKLQSNDKKGS